MDRKKLTRPQCKRLVQKHLQELEIDHQQTLAEMIEWDRSIFGDEILEIEFSRHIDGIVKNIALKQAESLANRTAKDLGLDANHPFCKKVLKEEYERILSNC